MTTKKDIRALTLSELSEIFTSIGEPAFRAKQTYEWLWKKSCRNFQEMSNLSKNIRQYLEENFVINDVKIDEKQVSNDGTVKCAFKLADNNVVEGVLIPKFPRMTACISSQVGCSLTCKFCATGKLKRLRNLNADEIYDQVVNIRYLSEEHYGTPLTNIVFMGMGEPLLNYTNVLKAIDKLTLPEGLNMSYKRITVSTAGIAKMIKKLGDDEVKFNLALSLHAANDEKRNFIMPINEQNSLAALKEALQYYYSKTGNQVTYEYIIFRNFNDTIQDAKELVDFCKHVPSKVNIIEYNNIDGGEFQQADYDKVAAFQEYLTKQNIVARIRRSRGKDIDAACGQLANKNETFKQLTTENEIGT